MMDTTTAQQIDHQTGIPAEQYDTLDFAAESLTILSRDLRYSPMEREYMAETRNRLNMILLSPRTVQP